ncbi:hypothetical protein GHT06_003762 [Daphnia sinensis]|uniref:Polysaccharide lyase 14 domain-containing protein n=1 Tax=Daphnia sinensis TaxID=1820382 RepID=A0AAD5KDJ9_9CRUS|nr:hypothetical protein GHT06_003762 [Daphnia sinensis]
MLVAPLLIAFLYLTAAKRSQCPAGSGLIFYRKFDLVTDGPYTPQKLRMDIPNITMATGRQSNLFAQNGALRTKLPRGCVGTNQCSYQWKVGIDHTLEAVFSYSIKFETGFDFVKGGKLAGLCGKTCPTGGRDASNGFSARNMWRANGRLVSYLYYHTKSDSFGNDIEWKNSTTGEPITLPVGEWINLYFWVRLNSIGKNDGLLLGYYNGELAVNQTINWRRSDDVYIDSFYFSNFYGGKGKSWAPESDMYIDFNDMQVCARDGFDWLKTLPPTPAITHRHTPSVDVYQPVVPEETPTYTSP